MYYKIRYGVKSPNFSYIEESINYFETEEEALSYTKEKAIGIYEIKQCDVNLPTFNSCYSKAYNKYINSKPYKNIYKIAKENYHKERESFLYCSAEIIKTPKTFFSELGSIFISYCGVFTFNLRGLFKAIKNLIDFYFKK